MSKLKKKKLTVISKKTNDFFVLIQQQQQNIFSCAICTYARSRCYRNLVFSCYQNKGSHAVTNQYQHHNSLCCCELSRTILFIYLMFYSDA